MAIASYYAVDPANIPGGIERVVKNFTDVIRHRDDIECHVLSCTDAVNEDKELVDGNLHVHFLRVPKLPHAVDMVTFQKYRTARKIRLLKPDIVHCHNTTGYASAGLSSRLPVVITPHSDTLREVAIISRQSGLLLKAKLALYRKVVESNLRRIKYIVIISNYIEKRLSGLLLQDVRKYHIYNSISDIFFESRGKPVPGRLLFAGRIDPVKNIESLLNAILQIKQTYPDVLLRIAGTPSNIKQGYMGKLLKFVDDNGLANHVHFLGQLDTEELIDELNQAEIFSLPSFQEVSPVVVAEAMACGKPVVCYDIEGVHHLVQPDVNGFLVTCYDDKAFANKLLLLLNNSQLRARTGEASRAIARSKFRNPVYIEKTIEMYKDILRPCAESADS